ncbi:hypothetical protein [Phenylobacterium sp.]|uniref:hypothetical protein n=1 Tax=Phenylobacterium sp. TaxID=1871053 RepID=UPI002F4091AA
MVSKQEMAERHGRVLAEFAELGLTLGRELAAKAAAAQTTEAAEALALAFHRISRSVRLTIALEMRLTRERQDVAKTHRVLAARAVETRKTQVQAAVTRAVYDERESDEADRLLDELDDLLSEETLYEEFAHGPVEACIARIRKGLGLSPAPPDNDPDPLSPFSLEGGRVGDGDGAPSGKSSSPSPSG